MINPGAEGHKQRPSGPIDKGRSADRPYERPSVCSVSAPRGPMCKHGHNPPCWRDNLWTGPLPARVTKNEKAVKAIEADRVANAERLGERCVPLTKSTIEEINVLTEEAIDEQWPDGVDQDDDCPLCPPSLQDTDVPAERGTAAVRRLAECSLTERMPGTDPGTALRRLGTAEHALELERMRAQLAAAQAAREIAEAKAAAVQPVKCEETKHDVTLEGMLAIVEREKAAAAAAVVRAEQSRAIAEAAVARAPVTPVKMGHPVPSTGARMVDFRVNLLVHARDAEACRLAGGVHDATNGVMYAPPRVDLSSLSAFCRQGGAARGILAGGGLWDGLRRAAMSTQMRARGASRAARMVQGDGDGMYICMARALSMWG